MVTIDSIKISNFLISFCSFYLYCPILEKDNFIETSIFYCHVLLNGILFFFTLCLFPS